MPWPRSQSLPALCPPCVRLVSALSPLWPRLLSTMCPPCVYPVPALSPVWPRPTMSVSGLVSGFGCVSKLCPPSALACVRLVSGLVCALAVPPNLVCHVFALPFKNVRHVSAKALPLDFVSPWLAVGQGRSIIRQNSFAPLRNLQRLYCRPAG